MSAQTKPVSPYQQALYNALADLKAQGYNAATAHHVAEAMGRSVTPSLRRRLKEAAAEGFVYEYQYYTERGGLAKGYWLAAQLPLPAMPEFPF